MFNRSVYSVFYASLFFLCQGTIFTSLACSEDAGVPTLNRLAKNNMQAFSWEEEDWPNERFEPFLLRCLQYQRDMQPFRKRKCALDIFKRYYNIDRFQSAHVLDDVVTWNDLALFHGQEAESPYLASIIDQALTEMGRITITSWVAHPTADETVLLQRQAVVKQLLRDTRLLHDLEEQLTHFKKSESLLLSFWVTDPFKRATERCYFNYSWAKSLQERLNNNETVVAGKNIFDHGLRISFVGTSAMTTCLLPVYGIKCLCTDENYGLFDDYSKGLIGVGGGAPAVMLSKVNNRYVQAATSIGSGIYCSALVEDAYEWMRGNFTLSRCLQEKMIHVARCIDAMRSVEVIIQQAGLSGQLQEFVHLQEICSESESKLSKLIDLLETKTFADEASAAAHYGRILVAYKLMDELHGEFETALIALGEIDAYLSIARLYKKHEHGRVQYSFVEYEKDKHSGPMIVLKDFWNPFVDVGLVSTNSLSIGGENPCNLVITGPNAGGKSTAIKAVAINLILAQSIGIAPARSIRITPFSYIATYLNITDDLAAGKSLFKAQVSRAKELTHHVAKMPHGQYSFLAIDEMFNGTDVRVGQALSYSVIKELGKQSGNITILATHFPLLTELEAQGNFSNYRVTAKIDDAGNVVYPFLLEPGISGQSVALDIVRQEGFSQEILDEAQSMLK